MSLTRWSTVFLVLAFFVWGPGGAVSAQDGSTAAAATASEPAPSASESKTPAAAPELEPAAGASAAEPAAVPAETALAPAEPTPTAGQEAPQPEVGREVTIGRAFLLKLKQGGITMVFLLLTSIAGLAYAVERLVNLRGSVILPDGLAEKADRLWREGKWEELVALSEKSNSTLARVISVIARHRHASMADVSMMAGDVASRDIRRHLQKAYPLAVVATVAPLLGLLGTVIGMIGAFDKVAAAGSLGDASLLGGDISKALITTAAGLTIAVPALVLYHYFKTRTAFFAGLLEEEVGELINAWYAPEPKDDVEGAEAGDEG